MQVGLIGAGNIARALARGWGEPVLCSDSGSGRARALVDELGGEVLSNVEVAQRADVVVLCHKPDQLDKVASELRGEAEAIISVLGATRTEDLKRAYPDTPVMRIMPNTPVEVRRGVICYARSSAFDARLEAQVIQLFERLGAVIPLDERLIETATAVSGVGPAYQALLAEAQVDAAVRHGLAAPVAGWLVTETMAGSAALLVQRDGDTLAVRREVASPGGGTIRGLAALERAGVRRAFQDAIDAVMSWSAR
jgi:pyrroline-5-carboxylate reductase